MFKRGYSLLRLRRGMGEEGFEENPGEEGVTIGVEGISMETERAMEGEGGTEERLRKDWSLRNPGMRLCTAR